MAFPKGYPRYVPREQFLDYLEKFAQRFDIRPRWGEEAVSARRDGILWELRTSPAAEGLYFCGFNVVGTGMLREISIEARDTADRIASA